MKTRPAGIGSANADWMGSLPSKLSAMPLKQLAVPGEGPASTAASSFCLCFALARCLCALVHAPCKLPPGSHDSFTYWVDVNAPVGPDQKSYVKYLATMFSVVAKKVMVKWSMTQVVISHLPTVLFFFSVHFYSTLHLYLQNLSFKEQLNAGIRYFDLRVSSKPGESGCEIYFIHGLFGHKVR